METGCGLMLTNIIKMIVYLGDLLVLDKFTENPYNKTLNSSFKIELGRKI